MSKNLRCVIHTADDLQYVFFNMSLEDVVDESRAK